MIIRNLIRTSFLLIPFALFSQAVDPDMGFVRHLEKMEAYEEGLLFLNLLSPSEYPKGTQDSIFHYRGKFHYRIKQFEKSIQAFSRINPQSDSLYKYAGFYSSIQWSYLSKFQQAISEVKSLSGLSGMEEELQFLFLKANYLLKRDLVAASSMDIVGEELSFLIKPHYEEMKKLELTIKEHKPKSPFIAGLLSAMVPGAGKYYQGLIGQGTMSLITSAVFGLQAYEGYRKDGVNSARFIVFTSLFSVFYVANIWGSVVSVRVMNRDFNESINESILVNMHIPLRNLYR